MSAKRGGMRLRSVSAWILEHGNLCVAFFALVIASFAFGFQIWHFQILRATALYESYEASEVGMFLEDFSFHIDYEVETAGENDEWLYITLHAKRFLDHPQETRGLVSGFLKRMEILHKCFEKGIFDRCNRKTVRALFGAPVVEGFYAISPYVYCDNFIWKTYGPSGAEDYISMAESLVKDFIEYEQREEAKERYGWLKWLKKGSKRQVFQTREAYEAALEAESIQQDEDYSVIAIGQNRPICEDYRKLLRGGKQIHRMGNYQVPRARRHSSTGTKPVRQLSLQPVAAVTEPMERPGPNVSS